MSENSTKDNSDVLTYVENCTSGYQILRVKNELGYLYRYN